MPRIAIVREEDCHPQQCGNYLCIRLCPVNRTGSDCIIPSPVSKKAYIDEGLCTGCGICPKRCPFGAIDIINLPDELCQTPLHQYGRNGFHLYSIPTPRVGQVIGIIGKNGIGKSTALKILAGQLKPNLGMWENEGATYDEVIKFFRGTEAQSYFEALKNGKIKVSYKPQQVEIIPKHMTGKVFDLLQKVDEKESLHTVAQQLGIFAILENDISTISGGELQRVAIAACALKKANVYFFDEPSSYLDIKQRFVVSNFIRSLANETTAVMVVEHDLIILDYMTDAIHLIFGKETAYGIVSQPKTSRVGINVYLDGYLKEENMRFREYSITFEKSVQEKRKQIVPLVAWKNISKKLGKFSLRAPNGTFLRNDVVGMLGENGIGKTTFVKLLAKVIDLDTGSIDSAIKVSYKPQYLDTESEELVKNVLSDAVMKYEFELITPLNLLRLLEKPLNELSGGELQRVSIAACLSKDADLYLLDEPSAYLDVEQRLVVCKIIRDIMQHRGTTALVVDHDLMFIDYLSDKILVCDGEPARQGDIHGPFAIEEGMNQFLISLDMTFRRDPQSNRPRANKHGSVKDREQRKMKRYYY